MRVSFKQIGVLVGVAIAIFSFLFFGRQQDTYQLLLISGFVITTVCYSFILFGKGRLKTKLLWTVIVIVCIVAQQITEPFLINTSYRTFIKQNENTLADINRILEHTNGDITITTDTIIHKSDQFTEDERAKLIEGRKKLGVYLISKTDHEVYYGLWGFLDVRLGITYWAEKSYPDIQYRHITGSWFR
jgi:hypothetical protein